MDLVAGIDEALGCTGIGRSGDDGIAHSDDVGCAGFRRVNGEASAATELVYVDPGRIDEERFGVDGGDCGLEVQAAGDFGGMDAVAVAGHGSAKLLDRVVITAGGQADPNLTTGN